MVLMTMEGTVFTTCRVDIQTSTRFKQDDLQPNLSSLVYLRTLSTIPDSLKSPSSFTQTGCLGTSTCYARDSVPKVAVECRDSGIAWLCKSKGNPGKSIRRRLHEVVVWAAFDADNYDNIIEYRFREDGSIGFRYGATGYNSQGGSEPLPATPHVHNGRSFKLFSLLETTSAAVRYGGFPE